MSQTPGQGRGGGVVRTTQKALVGEGELAYKNKNKRTAASAWLVGKGKSSGGPGMGLSVGMTPPLWAKMLRGEAPLCLETP